MNGDDSASDLSAGAIIGWCVLIASISQLPMIVLGYMASQVSPGGGRLLLLLSVPVAVTLLAGGIGLILRRTFGYYCVYLATFFGGFGGLKVSYIPFIQRWIKIGPATEDLFLGLNLLLVAVLVWEHWTRISNFELRQQTIHKVAILSLLVLGAGSIIFGRGMTQRDKGEVQSARQLPVVGSEFTGLQSSGPVKYVSVFTKINQGIVMIFSGISTEESIKALAETHNLKLMTSPEAHRKFLPFAKQWKLDAEIYPTQFGPEDLHYVGRLKNAPRTSLQLVFRKSDRRFTAQVFGMLPEKGL